MFLRPENALPLFAATGLAVFFGNDLLFIALNGRVAPPDIPLSEASEPDTAAAVVFYLADYLTRILVVLLALPAGLWPDRPRWPARKWERTAFIRLAFVGTVLGSLWFRLVSGILPDLGEGLYAFPNYPSALWEWGDLTAGLLLVAASEELIFRRWLQQVLMARARTYGEAWVWLVVTSVIFGAGHWGLGGNAVLDATVVGLGIGWIYWRTGSLWLVILIHFAIDFIDFAI